MTVKFSIFFPKTTSNQTALCPITGDTARTIVRLPLPVCMIIPSTNIGGTNQPRPPLQKKTHKKQGSRVFDCSTKLQGLQEFQQSLCFSRDRRNSCHFTWKPTVWALPGRCVTHIIPCIERKRKTKNNKQRIKQKMFIVA